MHFFFSVGEPSGDQHAAQLITHLRRRVPDAEFSGFGGPEMQQVGFDCHFQLTDLAVMGILPVIPLLLKFYKLVKQAERYFDEHQPDAVILVDFPGFNWWIARKAKARGIPVIYYMPPQLWAWAPWRIKKVRKFVDHVLCALPFEEQWYSERGISAECVGHPFFDEIAEHPLDEDFIEQWMDGSVRNVGLLPGSRNHEVKNNWPRMLYCVDRLTIEFPDVRFMTACYSEQHRERCEQMRDEYTSKHGVDLPIKFFVGKTPEIIRIADCCLMVSGSVSLELLARGTPAVVIYYMTPIFAAVARLLVTCKYASLPNLIADYPLMPEFFPRGKNKDELNLATERLAQWLRNDRELEYVRDEMEDLRDQVAQIGGIQRAALAVLKQLDTGRSAAAAEEASEKAA